MVTVESVEKGSLAEKAGILPKDQLLTIDSHPIRDVLDYRFFITERRITLGFKRNGAPFETVIEKGRYDDIGLEFETFLMDRKRSCANNCIFCFIDQNPCGMRETIYFKDDDTRLSFLMGNYVTLTNVSDRELERIVKMRLSPVNISVHTTDPSLRCKMLGNKNAGKILSQIAVLAKGEIEMNIQIVSCRGINDGAALAKTLGDLEPYFEFIQSVAVVPAGLTKHREGLYPLTGYDAGTARSVIEMIEGFQKLYLEKYGERKVFAADEFYVLASAPLPPEEAYEGYPQLDNGVGLLRNTRTEILDELSFLEESGEIEAYRKKERFITLATGRAAYEFMREICEEITQKIPNLHFDVTLIENRFFGDSVTVAGLLCGRDIADQLKEKHPQIVFIPAVSLRSERDRFLDDTTPEDLEKALGCPVIPVENGAAIFEALKTAQGG